MRDLRTTAGRRLAMVAVIVGTTLVTGCAEKQEASTTLPTPGEYAPIEPTTTADALPPLGPPDFPVPAEARTQDPAGAAEFLRYYIDLLDRQQALLVGQPLRDLGPECQECLRIARAFDDASAAGNRYEGGELTLNDVPPPQS